MSESKWSVTRVNGLPDAIVASDPDLGSVPIAKIVLGTDHEAHANMIAAAPELLEAAKELVYAAEAEYQPLRQGNILARASAAIAKAEGRS